MIDSFQLLDQRIILKPAIIPRPASLRAYSIVSTDVHIDAPKELTTRLVSAFGDPRQQIVELQQHASQGGTIDRKHYEMAVESCSKKRALGCMEIVIEMMRVNSLKPTQKIYKEVIGSYARAGDVRRIKSYFSAMRKDGVELDVEVYNHLLGVFTRFGTEDEVRSTGRTVPVMILM